jgi:ATP-dependent exoDNAse (exonuclease V) beta subunit
MENYIITGRFNTDSADIVRSFVKATEGFKHNVKQSESLLWHHEAKVAGTADVILENATEFAILDFKTNKKFNFFSAFNERLLYPLDHLDYCEYNIYSLQLALYAYMYELISGKRCKFIKILYLQSNFNNSGRFWKDIPILNCRETVEKIINYRINSLKK